MVIEKDERVAANNSLENLTLPEQMVVEVKGLSNCAYVSVFKQKWISCSAYSGVDEVRRGPMFLYLEQPSILSYKEILN